jgi:hypothetical protein
MQLLNFGDLINKKISPRRLSDIELMVSTVPDIEAGCCLGPEGNGIDY